MNDERSSRSATPQLHGRAAVVAISLAVIAFIGASWWGFVWAGPLGGLLGSLVGILLGSIAFTIIRASAAPSLDQRPAPDVRELPPDQAMHVLTAMLGASGAAEGRGSPAFGGGLLADIARADTLADAGDLDGALALLRALAEDHPRSPAVPAKIARLLASTNEHRDERVRAASTAISLAIPGGMARLAAQLYDELDDSERAQLKLDDGAWSQLAKVFSSRGEDRHAADCRARAGS